MCYNLEKIRSDFPALNDFIYLDNAATSQKPLSMINVISNYLKKSSNYGRGIYKLALETTEKCENVRIKIGSFFNVNPKNIIFTKSTTDGINIVVNGLKLKKNDHIIVSSIEHNSNFSPWVLLKKRGIEVTILDVDSNGYICIEEIKNKIKKNTKIISIAHISNFYGSIQNIEEIIRIAHDLNVKVVIDGAQSAGHIKIDLKHLDCDIFVTSGHKGLLGPQGIGILYLKNSNLINPNCFGGGNIENIEYPTINLKPTPQKFEAGTPNIPGILGLGASIDYINEIGIKKIEKHEKEITNYCLNNLKQISNIEIYGEEKKTNIISFNIKNIDPNSIALYLDNYDICIRSGYHCSNYIHNKLGIDGSIRVSIGLYNTKFEIDILIYSINEIVSNIIN